MIILWKTTDGFARITPQECTRVTPSSVWFMRTKYIFCDGEPKPEMVEAKSSRFGGANKYHETWEAAHDCLMEQAALTVQSKRRQLELSHAHHGNVKGMKKPG